MTRSASKTFRVAAMDIGSNAARLEISRGTVRAGGKGGSGGRVVLSKVEEMFEDRVFTRLGRNIAQGGPIPDDAMRLTIDAIASFAAKAREFKVHRVRAVATAAAREATNGAKFLELATKAAGVPVEIIGAAEECRLAYGSAAGAFEVGEKHALVIDVGGGTLQVVRAMRGVLYEALALPLGAVRLTSMFGGAAEFTGKASWKACTRHIDAVLKEHLLEIETPIEIAIGSGGTFTSLGAVAQSSPVGGEGARRRGGKADKAPVSLNELEEVMERVRGMSLQERLTLPGVTPDRADILPAGLLAASRAMRLLGADRVFPHSGGVKEGITRRMLEELAGETSGADKRSPVQVVRSFAQRSHYEKPHSEHVAGLALQLLGQVAEIPAARGVLKREPHAAALLEAGALVHDLGTLIEYKGHHKHSERIVRLARLPGWSERELELIALLARFHRKSEPSESHPAFAALPRTDRELLELLAGVLRVADGFDRSHGGVVHTLAVERTGGRLAITGVAGNKAGKAELAECLEGAVAKSGLLARALAGAVAERGGKRDGKRGTLRKPAAKIKLAMVKEPKAPIKTAGGRKSARA